MTSPLLHLSSSQLRALAAQLKSGTIRLPTGGFEIHSAVPVDVAPGVARELNRRREHGAPALVELLILLAAQRDLAEKQSGEHSLVWTGPTAHGLSSRDTRVVVRELFESAERHVIVSTYAMFNGRELFEPLAERMAAVPGLRVQLFTNVAPGHGMTHDASRAKFAHDFRANHWPWQQLPEVYFDPRSLDPSEKAVLHAKCVVVDGVRALVTSANLTESATERNVEAGILTTHPSIPRELAEQFVGLIEAGLVERVGFG